jgi:hypothetical protein
MFEVPIGACHPHSPQEFRFMTSPVHGARVSCFDPDSSHGASAMPDCSYEPPTCSHSAVDDLETPRRGAWDALREPGLRFCREADSVVEGFLCDEPVVVSNACRQPKNAFDAFVCDEPRMRSLQRKVINETLSILKTLLLDLLGR